MASLKKPFKPPVEDFLIAAAFGLDGEPFYAHAAVGQVFFDDVLRTEVDMFGKVGDAERTRAEHSGYYVNMKLAAECERVCPLYILQC